MTESDAIEAPKLATLPFGIATTPSSTPLIGLPRKKKPALSLNLPGGGSNLGLYGAANPTPPPSQHTPHSRSDPGSSLPPMSAVLISRNHTGHPYRRPGARATSTLKLATLNSAPRIPNADDFNEKPLPTSAESKENSLVSSAFRTTASDLSPTLVEDFNGLHVSKSVRVRKQFVLTADIVDLSEQDWMAASESGLITSLATLGEGNGGCVKKCRLENGKQQIFALKTITKDPNPRVQKQIVRELTLNSRLRSPYIVQYFGTFRKLSDASICICMEYMGGKSVYALFKTLRDRGQRIKEKPLGKIAEGVMQGLAYLNEQNIIHRDIKPQNILLDSEGNVKLCDFGVSVETANSLASTFTGTSFYMAPERLRGEKHTKSCDVWSLGMTLFEGANGEFPFTDQISPLDLYTSIFEFEPVLEDTAVSHWTDSFRHFVGLCLEKDVKRRGTAKVLLRHPWLQAQRHTKVNMKRLLEKLQLL